ncbi:MAG: hypothetical protein ABI779_13705 [Acidobacteriota bacterium]
MRVDRLGILLVVSVLSVACSHATLIARHRPMHPGNAQAVTFEASAVNADRVTLSYERYSLTTGTGGTHVQTLAVAETEVKTCNPAGSSASITCTHTMPSAFPFPAASLIAYTARAWDSEGVSTAETYSFAAGDYPWPDDPIPIRLKGEAVRSLDAVLIPDTDITVASFRDQLDEVIEMYFRYEQIRLFRGVHNFYYSSRQGNYEELCNFTNPPNMANLLAVADSVAILHTTNLRDCRSGIRMSSEIDYDKTLIHETGHALFGLMDEYCCDSSYASQPCQKNLYDSLASCQSDAPNVGLPASNCTQLAGTTTLNFWRIDPTSGPGCMMGPGQHSSTSEFREACKRRMQWRYGKCLGGDCFPSPECP